VIGVPIAGNPVLTVTVTVLELVGKPIAVTTRPVAEANENGLLLIVVKFSHLEI
jgi:hypothetical protein